MSSLRVASLGIVASLAVVAAPGPAQPRQPLGPVAITSGDVPDGGVLRVGRIVKRRFETFGDSVVSRGEGVQELSRITWRGSRVLLSIQHFAVADGPAVDSTFVDAATLAPIRHIGTFPSRVMELWFAGDSVTGRYDRHDAPHQPVAQATAVPTYDSSVFDLVIAALPLREGYTAHLPFYLYERGGLVWWDARVTGPDDLTLGDGTVAPAWVVEVSEAGQHRMDLWITREGPRDVLRSVYLIGPGHTYTTTR